MYKIVICDDEGYIREQLQNFLHTFQEKQGLAFQISCYSAGEELLRNIEPDIDLILLDIRMERLSGMAAAHRLRALGCRACLIFITSMVQYALEGYEVHAFAFIKKPLSYLQFERTLQDALCTLDIQHQKSLSLYRGTFLDSVQISSILYVETLDHTSIVVTLSDRYEYRVGLSKLAEELAPHGFGICHKSYLVNYQHIRSIQTASILLINGQEIPLSRHRRKQFIEQFTNYLEAQL